MVLENLSDGFEGSNYFCLAHVTKELFEFWANKDPLTTLENDLLNFQVFDNKYIETLKSNHKQNPEDVFGSQHGVINWLCTADIINTTLQAVVDRDDTVERMAYRQRQ